MRVNCRNEVLELDKNTGILAKCLNYFYEVSREQRMVGDGVDVIGVLLHPDIMGEIFEGDLSQSNYQVNYHFRALQPILLNWHRGADLDYTSIIELLDGIYTATATEGQGKPAWIPPAAMKWPSCEFGGSFDWWNPDAQSGANRGTYAFPRYMESLFTTMAQAYAVTDDVRYKQVLEEMASIRMNQLAGVYSDTSTEGTIGWAAKKAGKNIVEAIEKLAAIGKPLNVDIPSQYSDYYKWVANDDFTELEDYLDRQTQAFGCNRMMFMEEVRFTDRVDKFNKEYLGTLLGKDYETPNVNAL